MIAFLLWCILFVLCWPLAILALVLYPLVWLMLLPFRIAGIAVHGVLALILAVVMLPARLLSAPFRLGVIRFSPAKMPQSCSEWWCPRPPRALAPQFIGE